MAVKIVISDPKAGKTYQTELEQVGVLAGKKVGEVIQGSLLNMPDYELEITGGSDKVGNPMRKEVEGSAPRRLLLTKGVGFKPRFKGERRKKRVLGRTISADIVQVNAKVVKYGSRKLESIFAPAAEEKTEGAPAEEAKPEEKKEETPAEAPKEERPAEESKEEKK